MASNSSLKPEFTTAALVGGVAILGVQLLTPADPIGATLRFFRLFRSQKKHLTCSSDVNSGIDEYNRLHSVTASTERNKEYKSLVNSYYDLATLFYEAGWGQSFHFANRYSFESFAESIRRHEYYLASKLGVSGNGADIKVLDVGCGIGGPMRNITRFLNADVTGITLNQYQVERGNEITLADDTVSGRCRSVQGDFMNMPFSSEMFDAAYAIEATCHAPDRIKCYSEIRRVLKPGAIFACYEWCTTDAFDPKNPKHLKIKKQIEEGDGLPDIASTKECKEALERAGFEILDERDLADDFLGYGGKPWMLPLMPSWNPFTQRFQFNWLGRNLTKYGLKLMEFCFLAPKGTSKTQIMLQTGGIGCAQGGTERIFTPMYLMVGRVPHIKEDVVGGQ
jgi:sterol 24-C-methyltransferase